MFKERRQVFLDKDNNKGAQITDASAIINSLTGGENDATEQAEYKMPSAGEQTEFADLMDAAHRIYGTEGVINGEAQSIRYLVHQVQRKVKMVDSKTTVDLETRIKLADLPGNLAGLCKGQTIAIDLDTALANHKDLPFIVLHEAGHAGFLKVVNGVRITDESVADLAARRESGMDLESDYSESDKALDSMIKTLEGAGDPDAGGTFLKYYAEGRLDEFLKLVIHLNAKETEARGGDQNEGLAMTLTTFQKALPFRKIAFEGKHLVDDEETYDAQGELNRKRHDTEALKAAEEAEEDEGPMVN